jgi:hypothetical protein
MTLFGSRDFERPRGEAAVQLTPITGGQSVITLGAAVPIDDRRILLRVHGGEDIVVGTAGDREEGVQLARRMMRLIDDAEAHGEWPELDDRFIRPSAIVSIDVQRAD